jgi:hypothetical protein
VELKTTLIVSAIVIGSLLITWLILWWQFHEEISRENEKRLNAERKIRIEPYKETAARLSKEETGRRIKEGFFYFSKVNRIITSLIISAISVGLYFLGLLFYSVLGFGIFLSLAFLVVKFIDPKLPKKYERIVSPIIIFASLAIPTFLYFKINTAAREWVVGVFRSSSPAVVGKENPAVIGKENREAASGDSIPVLYDSPIVRYPGETRYLERLSSDK